MSDHDHLVLQHAREGDIDAVASLLQNHQRSLYRVTYSILLDTNLARQAVQEALLAALYTPGKHPANEPFDIWLKSLAVRASHSLSSRRPPIKAAEMVSSASDHPNTGLWNAYHQLNIEYQIPLALRYFHGYSVEQIARLMRVGQNTVRTRLGAGRSRIMTTLQLAGTEDSPLDETTLASSIGHDQARFLLQSSVDESLSSQEWVPLQSHLDHCEGCRTYRRKLQGLERDLQHALRAYLEMPGELPPLDAEKLLARQRAGMRSRNFLRSAGKFIGTAASLAIGLFLAYAIFIPGTTPPSLPGTLTAEAALAAQVTPTTIVTPTPPIAEPFRTPVVFQSNRDGNDEVYLLDPDGQAINLTDNPAADTFPMWSPDGEWIAFLSDRSGKNEVYLLHVSGTRLVQTTDEPDITWQGPISWSSDGQRLAISGAWSQDEGRTWIYLINLKRSNEVVRLSLTRDAYQPRWAPEGSQLAYQLDTEAGSQIYTRRVDRHEAVVANDPMPNDNQVFKVPHGGFDWSPKREGIVYVVDGPYRLSRPDLNLSAEPGNSSQLQTKPFISSAGVAGTAALVWKAPSGQQVISTSWSPRDQLVFLKDGSPCSGSNHWQIALTSALNTALALSSQPPPTDPLVVPGLCAASPLTDSAWSPDGRWLVMAANPAQEEYSSLYALDVIKMQADLALNPQALLPLLRLTGLDGHDSLPQVRPQSAQRGIDPAPVEPAVRSDPLPPTSLAGVKTKVIFSALSGGNYEIFSAALDGSAKINLSQNPANDHLVAVQEDTPGWIAFVSDREGGLNEIFVVGSDGANPVQLTNVPTDPRPFANFSYQSFSWSPDGSRLATEVLNQNGKYLALLPSLPSLQDGQINQYFQLQGDLYTRPLWMENGQKIYMASSGGNAMGLIILDPAADPLYAIDAPRINWPENNWGRINDMIAIPSAGQLAFLATRQLSGSVEATVGLFVGDQRGEKIDLLASIQVPNQQYQVLNADVAWLEDSQQFLVLITAPVDQKIKSTFSIIDASSGFITTLYQTEDYVIHQAISPDGKWLLFNTETGLWALNIQESLAAKSGPAQISNALISGFDWKP